MTWQNILTNPGDITFSRVIPVGPFVVTPPLWTKTAEGAPQGFNLWNQEGFPGGQCYRELGVGVALVDPNADTLTGVRFKLRYTGTPTSTINLRVKIYAAETSGVPALSPPGWLSVPYYQQDFAVNITDTFTEIDFMFTEPEIMNYPYVSAAIVLEHVSGGDYPITVAADNNAGAAIGMPRIPVEGGSIFECDTNVVPLGTTFSVATGGTDYSTASVQEFEYVKQKWYASPYHVNTDGQELSIFGEPGSSATDGAQVLGLRKVFAPENWNPIWRFTIRMRLIAGDTITGLALQDQPVGEEGGMGLRYNPGGGIGIRMSEAGSIYLFAQTPAGLVQETLALEPGTDRTYQFVHQGNALAIYADAGIIGYWDETHLPGILEAFKTLAYFATGSYMSEPPSPNGLVIDYYTFDEWIDDPPAPPVNPGPAGFLPERPAQAGEGDDWWKTKRAMRESV